MQINPKYKLGINPLSTEVVELLDFQDYPILSLERDNIGNSYISYLIEIKNDIEKRAIIQISKERLIEIITGNFDIKLAYDSPENNNVFICDFSLNNGDTLNTYLLPSTEFVNPIPDAYFITLNLSELQPKLDTSEILDYSIHKNKIVLDLYIKSQNLVNNIKPYAFYKIVTPIVEIIKSFLSIDQRNVDKYLAFSNLRQSSLGVTVEINYSRDLFLERESAEISKLMELLKAQTKEDFESLVSRTQNEKHIREFSKIIKAVIDNNACLYSAYANPITKDIIQSVMNKESAQKAREIIEERFEIIEDIEYLTGNFLEIDIKEPSFKILSFEDGVTIKGKIDQSVLEKIKANLINIGKTQYNFTIKTFYHPETTIKSEEIKRYLISYEEILLDEKRFDS